MSHEETKRPVNTFDFFGHWLPSHHPFLAGGKNFADLCNMMPCLDGLCGVPGYARVTEYPVSEAWRRIQSGIQIRQKTGVPSRILVQAASDDPAESVIMAQFAADAEHDVPAINDFDIDEPMHYDAQGAGLGRFARWPNNSVAYCNSKETLIYGGDEMPPAGFLVGSSPLGTGDEILNAIDYTDAVRNTLSSPGNIARVAASVDAYTKLYIPFEEGEATTDFVDESGLDHVLTPLGSPYRGTKYPKFGAYAGVFAPGDGLTAAASGDWSFGADNFTLTAQGRLGFGQHGLLGQYLDGNNYWYSKLVNSIVDIGSGYLVSFTTVSFKAKSAGSTVADYSWTFYDSLFKNAWYNKYQHIEISRSGTDMLCFRNGRAPGSASSPTDIGSAAMPDLAETVLDIGEVHNGAYSASGRLDEICVDKGIARHTTPFAPPTAARGGMYQVFVVLTNRPISQVKPYLSALNQSPAASLTGSVWAGAEWLTLELTDGSEGLSVSEGVISFESTVGIAQKKLLNGQYRYAYAFELSDGAADIYQVTVGAPIQPLCDIWDSAFRPVLEFGHYHNGKYIDDTAKVLEATPAGQEADEEYVASLGYLTSSEYIDIATAERAGAFRITMYEGKENCVNVTVATLAPHYWDGRAFVAHAGVADGTLDAETGTKTLNRTGHLSFTVPDVSQEFPKTEKGVTAWRYRLTPSDTLNSTGGSGKVWIDKVEAIPASQLPNNLGYKFPFMLGTRAMLCNLATAGEGNRVDYALSASTEGWNGEDSSLGEGRQPIYIGDSEDLICACEIYTRLSASIYTFGLFLKAHECYLLNGFDAESFKWYPLSDKVGCPAPLSLDTYHLLISQERQTSRTIACWISYSGPYMYDSGDIIPIPGMECYFDPDDPRCINFAAIEKAIGWFDPDKPHYNIQIPSGPDQTENNVWLAFDYSSRRWFCRIIPDAHPYLSAVIRVADAAGKEYMYGAVQPAEVEAV